MGKNFSTIQSVVKNHESLTLKQMFDVTAQLVNNQELCLGKVLQHPESNEDWKNRVAGIRSVKATEIMMLSMESRLNSSGTSSQDSQRCSSVIKSVIF